MTARQNEHEDPTAMSPIVDLRTEVLNQHIFELRYAFGYSYWDRAGRTLGKLLEVHPDWEHERIDGNSCRLIERERGLVFNFGMAKLDFSQTQKASSPDLLSRSELATVCDSLASTVVTGLGVERFSRIGLRIWYLFPTADIEEADRRISQLAIFNRGSEQMARLGEVSSPTVRITVERPQHLMNISIQNFEQQVKLPPGVLETASRQAYREERQQRKVRIEKLKAERMVKSFPKYGVLLDLDAYIDQPPFPDELSVSDFIFRAIEDFDEVKKVALAAADQE